METERLIIRRFSPEDGQDLYEYLSDEDVIFFEPYKAFGREEAINEAKRRAADKAFWAVCLKENSKLIGNLYFNQQEPNEYKTWEIGFVFNKNYHGRGYATESAKRILQYGFEECGAHRITAYCSPLNKPSWQLLERLNMRREGHFLQSAFFKRDKQGNPVWHDAYAYAILTEEWFNRE